MLAYREWLLSLATIPNIIMAFWLYYDKQEIDRLSREISSAESSLEKLVEIDTGEPVENLLRRYREKIRQGKTREQALEELSNSKQEQS